MPAFMTRVVLHKNSDLSHNAYGKLHAAMAAEGFERVIVADSKTLHLPPAEYRYPNAVDESEVWNKANRASATVDSDYGIIVMGEWLTCSGLKSAS